MPLDADPPSDSSLNVPKHLTYWKRCLKTFLPHFYTSNDCNRLTLAFFIISALDLLRVRDDFMTPEERADYVNWLYHNQHPNGGFRGSPATDLGQGRNADNECWDPANVPATFFALSALVILGDDLQRVKRRQCLEWLPKMQRADGSFGETMGEGGHIEGGQDPRFGYCAAGVRWILRGNAEGSVEGVRDINVQGLVRCIRQSETYDGGISEAPFHEAHAGFTYCAIGALAFLGHLPTQTLADPELTVRWLVARQTSRIEEDDSFDVEDAPIAPSMVKLQSLPSSEELEGLSSHPELPWAGFNGRCNKIADTCYAWWVGASLAMLDKLHLTSEGAMRRYLLDKTQHVVGGFGKLPGDPPDIYHSYLGLASLALLRDPDVKPINAMACISEDACKFLESLPWRQKITGSTTDPVNVESSGGG
ncbi:geranylgeranyl transferase-like protein type i beta subunit [Phyllosticta capitalensis]